MEIATIQVDSTDALEALPQVRRFLILVMLLALKDRAVTISHRYGPGLSKLAYQVEGQWCDLVPLDESLGPEVGRELRNWLSPGRFRRWLADRLRNLATWLDPNLSGTIAYPFLLIVGPTWSLWEATLRSNDFRGSVDLELLESSDWAREQTIVILEAMIRRNQAAEPASERS